jgi:hypothetical protein
MPAPLRQPGEACHTAASAVLGAAAGVGTRLLVGLAAADAGYGTVELLQWRYDLASPMICITTRSS